MCFYRMLRTSSSAKKAITMRIHMPPHRMEKRALIKRIYTRCESVRKEEKLNMMISANFPLYNFNTQSDVGINLRWYANVRRAFCLCSFFRVSFSLFRLVHRKVWPCKLNEYKKVWIRKSCDGRWKEKYGRKSNAKNQQSGVCIWYIYTSLFVSVSRGRTQWKFNSPPDNNNNEAPREDTVDACNPVQATSKYNITSEIFKNKFTKSTNFQGKKHGFSGQK